MDVKYFLFLFFYSFVGAMDDPRAQQRSPIALHTSAFELKLYLDYLPPEIRNQSLPLYLAGARRQVRDNRGDGLAEQIDTALEYKKLLEERYAANIPQYDALVMSVLAPEVPAQSLLSSPLLCLPNRLCMTATLNPKLLRQEFSHPFLRAIRIAEANALSQDQRDESAVQIMRRCPSKTVISGMLQGGASVNAYDKKSRFSLLRLAVEAPIKPSRKKRLIELLINHPRINPDESDTFEITPLMRAASLEDEETVESLLPKSDVNALDRHYNTALGIAARQGNKAIVEKILSLHPNFYLCHPYHGSNNVLAQAVQCSDACQAVPVLEVLVRARNTNSDVNNVHHFQQFVTIAIIQAALLGRFDCVSFLIDMPGITFDKLEEVERRRSPFNPDYPAAAPGRSALTASLKGGFFDISLFLLEHTQVPTPSSLSLCRNMREKALTHAVKLRCQRGVHDARKAAQLDAIINQILELSRVPLADTMCLSACYQAAAGNNTELLKKLFDYAGKKDPEIGGKVLLDAAKRADETAIRTLLTYQNPDKDPQSINPNIVDMNGNTPLHHATATVTLENLESVKILLNNGASVFHTNKWGQTVFHHVPRNPHVSVHNELLSLFAEQVSSPELIKILVNVARFDTGETPLLVAAGIPHCTKTVAKLLELEAAVNRADTQGNTPLHRACEKFLTDTVGVLLKAGADPNAKNKSGCGPFTKIAGAHLHKEEEIIQAQKIARLLNTSGARLDDFKDSMLRNAARRGNTPLVRDLLTLGADVNKGSSSFANTALHKAAQKGYEDTVALLLNHQADPHAKNKRGLTPLEVAVQSDTSSYEVVEALMFHKKN